MSEPLAWITAESLNRIKQEGGNHSRGSVPVHAKRSSVARFPLYDASGWQPIETAPKDGYFLVYEDGAMRALMRIDGNWHKVGYPALVSDLWGINVVVGEDAKRILAPMGYRLELRDGCCEDPTHWMPLPEPPNGA